MGIGESRKNRR